LFGQKKLGWPRRFLGPHEGTLNFDTAERLVELLKPFVDESLYFYFSILAFGLKDDALTKDLAIRLPKALANDDWSNSPTYIFTESKDMCIYTDWDLTYSFVGARKEIVATIVQDDFLEAVEVQENTPLTIPFGAR
jgi:hypothetical protein